MTNAALLGTFGDVSASPLVFRNKIINGGFDIWQRGTSQTSSGYGSDDRWYNPNSGSTKTASRQTFTVGQTDVPDNPRYWARTVVTTSAGSSNYCAKSQLIENVLTLSGQVATLSFWAKADAAKNIAVEFAQGFGTGGSPSSTVNAIGVTTVALTTNWARYSVTVSLPSITGKTLGTNNDSYLETRFWFDAGSSFNARTNSLGQQSGTFDIANVQLEAGSAATPFEQRPVGLELSLCQRYFQKFSQYVTFTPQGSSGANTLGGATISTPVRAAVSGTHTGTIWINGVSATYTTRGFSINANSSQVSMTAQGGSSVYGSSVVGSLDFDISAEL